MYITKKDYYYLCSCAKLLLWDKLNDQLCEHDKKVVSEAVKTCQRLERKKARDTRRSSRNMDRYRKTDPRYYRNKPDMAKVLAASEDFPIDNADEIMKTYSQADLYKVYRAFWNSRKE